MHKGFGCAAVFALIVAAPVRADLYSAQVAYKSGEYAKAFKEYRELAELGQPTAQFNVAALYANGQGVARSLTFAYAWSSIAADSGHKGGRSMADELRPQLTPGAIGIADCAGRPKRTSRMRR